MGIMGQPAGKHRPPIETSQTPTSHLPDPGQRLIRGGGRDHGRQGLLLPVHDDKNLMVAVEFGIHDGDRGAGNPQALGPQPLPCYFSSPPADKPKFAGADMSLDAPLHPPEPRGVRHFVRQNVSGRGANAGNTVDYWSITRWQWCRVKVMLYH